MDGTEQGGPDERPGTVAGPPRLAVTIGRAPDASHACRVDAPDRVLRIWALLSNAEEDLHAVPLSPEIVAGLRRQLDVLTAELERSLSPALASEMHRLIGPDHAAEITPDELRVKYASVLAWTAGLVIGILTQLEAAGKRAVRPSATGRPVNGRPGRHRPGS